MGFEEHRAHLLGVGYRITGSRADAEDAVQDAWLRWAGLDDAERAAIRDERAWFVTTVGRIGLDRLRSAAVRRERYVGPWLPEPLVTSGGQDPLDQVVRTEDVRQALVLVLDRLAPPARVAFVLHDVAGVPFADVADVLGGTPEAARQHASRARRVLTDATASGELPPRADASEHTATLSALVAALASGDLAAVTALLHPDARLHSDGGGVVPAARNVIRGADRVARAALGLVSRHAVDLDAVRAVHVNGEPGLLLTPPNQPVVVSLVVSGGRVVAIQQTLNPEKLPAER